ncbi:hypothetical protein BOTBODRAFT_165233 [Botryobasidium botryosum FD-172 SS1]|uniref:Fungal-type protein kinase domain-containing protein n=1 Tax=Botryobasidium botryosum (strain FD-172 SS1) TaxID=930990 RepID=A0A067M0G2_BOTB1|nr:hypothetical protein BOTBODRAFT_165233 [Botryobasidium botryosum FD-172 SS1]
MRWPNWILEKFITIPGGTRAAAHESLFYGPYNTLLHHLFPPQEHFMVVPKYRTPRAGSSADCTAIFIVYQVQIQTPIFFLEIKPPFHFDELSSREAADGQMRDSFREFVEALQIPILHGVSALGTRLAFYQYDAESTIIKPIAIPRDPIRVNDTAPQVLWHTDVLSDEGVQLIGLVVDEIKEMCQEIV